MVKIKDMLEFDRGVNEHWLVDYKGDTINLDPTKIESFEADESHCQTVITFKDQSVTALDGLTVYNTWINDWREYNGRTN